jgi:hypothetical protein
MARCKKCHYQHSHTPHHISNTCGLPILLQHKPLLTTTSSIRTVAATCDKERNDKPHGHACSTSTAVHLRMEHRCGALQTHIEAVQKRGGSGDHASAPSATANATVAGPRMDVLHLGERGLHGERLPPRVQSGQTMCVDQGRGGGVGCGSLHFGPPSRPAPLLSHAPGDG